MKDLVTTVFQGYHQWQMSYNKMVAVALAAGAVAILLQKANYKSLKATMENRISELEEIIQNSKS